MKRKSAKFIFAPWILALFVLIAIPLRAQDATAQAPAELPAAANAAPPAQTAQAPPVAPPAPAAANAAPDRHVTWGGFVPNVLHDQKEIWLFPFSMARGHHLLPALVFVGGTAALAAFVDNPSGRYFQRTQSFTEFNSIFSDSHTAWATVAFPAGFYGVGVIRRDSYAQHTFLLAGEAALDSVILATVMKDISRREQPDEVPIGGSFTDTWFRDRGNPFGGFGSFPSGHGIEAFTIATVFADRYPKYKWVAYGLAGLVGFSRISLQAHNPSDVFAGAFLGYVIAHYTVEHFH